MTSHCTVEGQSGNFMTDPSSINPTLHLMKFWMQEKLEIECPEQEEEIALQFLACMLG